MNDAGKPQTIFRNASPKRKYTQLCNDMLQNAELSLEATGFLARVLSLPPHWEFYKSWAEEKFRIGEKKLERILKETAKHGFSRHEQSRNPDGTHGRVIYSFTDVPWTFDDDDRTPKSDPAVDSVAKEHRTPLDGAAAERGCRKGGTINNLQREKEREIEMTKPYAENGQQRSSKKYNVRPMGVELEDVQSLVQDEIKSLDLDWVLAGGALFHEGAYPELLEIMNKHGHANTEAAILGYLRAIAGGRRNMRRGGIRSWKYFDRVVADYVKAEKKAEEIRLRDEIMSELLY
jgi:hypothetical protein